MIDTSQFHIIATCPNELRSALSAELREIGVTDLKDGYRAVHGTSSEDIFYKAHLKSRIASQMHVVIKDIPAKSGEMLFSQTRRIPWELYLKPNQTFRVDGTSNEGPEFSAIQVSKRVRQAVQERIMNTTQIHQKTAVEEPDVVINAYLFRGRCTLSLLSSGKSMHKRGYRLEGHPAPIKETLAAGVLSIAGYNGEQVLYDPMCGSGTIPIEAAYMALAKAPLIHRKKGQFAFEGFPFFNSQKWRHIQDEIRLERKELLKAPIYGSDINPEFVQAAINNAERARIKEINFFTSDFFDSKKQADSGLLIANLPYGERLYSEEDLKVFYKQIGDHVKHHFKGWRIALLTADSAPWKFIGLKTSERHLLQNGAIQTRLLIYDIY